jgi:uncharacterized protein DUF4351
MVGRLPPARSFAFTATIRSGPMHEYDVALKNILTRPGSSVLAQLTGASSLKWINVEAPKVSNRRVDLLGELPDGSLVHIELQSRNEKMPIMEDIMDHDVIGPAIRKGLRQGRVEGQVEMLTSLIEKRFGRVPAVSQRIAALKPAQLKRVGLRLLDAQRIEDLFAR